MLDQEKMPGLLRKASSSLSCTLDHNTRDDGACNPMISIDLHVMHVHVINWRKFSFWSCLHCRENQIWAHPWSIRIFLRVYPQAEMACGGIGTRDPNMVGSIPVEDHLARVLGQVASLEWDVKWRFFCTWSMPGQVNDPTQVGGKCITCCGLAFSKITESTTGRTWCLSLTRVIPSCSSLFIIITHWRWCQWRGKY
jgi:hypothetical protein